MLSNPGKNVDEKCSLVLTSTLGIESSSVLVVYMLVAFCISHHFVFWCASGKCLVCALLYLLRHSW